MIARRAFVPGEVIGVEGGAHRRDIDLYRAGRGAGLAAEAGVQHAQEVRFAGGEVRGVVSPGAVPGAQGVGAPLGAVAQIGAGLEARAHRRRRGIAEALGVAVAAEGPGQRVSVGRVEGAERGRRDAHDGRVVGHQLAGIVAAGRIKGRLDALQRAMGLGSDPVAQIGAAHALAVFAPENSTVLAGQRINRVRYRDEFLAIAGGIDVQGGADVKTADIDMAVNAEAETVVRQNGEEFIDEGRKVLGRDHRVLDEGDRAGGSVNLSQQADARRTDRPEFLDLGQIADDMNGAGSRQVRKDCAAVLDPAVDGGGIRAVDFDEDIGDPLAVSCAQAGRQAVENAGGIGD